MIHHAQRMMTAPIGAIRGASATKLWGVSGHSSTPEPAKRPTFSAVTFGAIIAYSYRTYRRASSRVGRRLTQHGDRLIRLALFSLQLFSQNQPTTRFCPYATPVKRHCRARASVGQEEQTG